MNVDEGVLEPLNSKDRCKNCLKNYWLNKGTKEIFLCYVIAYTIQTSMVASYIKYQLEVQYGVQPDGECEKNETYITSSSEEGEDPGELCENDLKSRSIDIVKLSTIPAFILAPFFASFSDGVNRILLLYLSNICMVISALATVLTITFSDNIDTLTWCSLPAYFTGGIILMTVFIFSYESDVLDGFKLFEKFLELTAVSVSGKAISQLLLTLFPIDYGNPNNIIIWFPVAFAFMGIIWMISKHSRIKDNRQLNLSFSQKLCKILPLDFVHFCKRSLFMYILLLFLCGFFYYFDYVGETVEVIDMVEENEPWQFASVSLQGVVQTITESISLFLMLYFFKQVVHKRIVDKRLLPKVPLSYLGILALLLDFITKVIVSLVPSDSNAQFWVPLIGVICELAIVVIRYFAVALVPKEDSAKSLTLLAWAQILAIVPGPLMIEAVANWSETFWSNFVYVFMALILIIPSLFLWVIGKFGPLPDLIHHKNPVEEEEEPRENRNKFYNSNLIFTKA